MNKQEARCDTLIAATAAALNEDAVALMLVTVQKNNLRLSVNIALQRSVPQFNGTAGGHLIEPCRVYSRMGVNNVDTRTIVRECLFPFPLLWASVHLAFIVLHAHDGSCHPSG